MVSCAALTTRRSTRRFTPAPSASTYPVSSTRRSLPCGASSRPANSSRNSVPPSDRSRYPLTVDSRPGERAAPVTKQQALHHVARQGAEIDIDDGARTIAAFVDVLGEELLPPCRWPRPDWGAGPRVALGQHERASHGGRAADNHGPIPFGSRGAVTLSPSASVFKMRSVRNRYSSVCELLRSALPNRPPMIGRCEMIGIPV